MFFFSRQNKTIWIKVKISQYIYALLIAGAAFHTPLHASDLMEIYREALEQDAQYSAARAAHQAAQEKLPQGRAGLLPTITLGAVRRRQYIDVGTTTGVGGIQNNPAPVTIDPSSVTLTATQPLYRKENFVIYEQSKIQVAQADSQFIIAAQELILRVAQAYFDILLALINLEVAEAQKKAIGEQLAQAKRNFQVGTVTIVDTHEAQARFDLSLSQEIVARNDLEVRKRALQQIIGRLPDNLVRPNENSANSADLFNLKYANMQDWISVAEQNNLAMKVQQSVYEIAKQEVERAKAGHYPTVDLVALYSDQKGVGGAVTGRPIDLTTKEIGIQLNFPIFQGFAVQSRVREALATQEKVFQDLNNTRRNSVLQVSQQYLNVTNGIAQMKALRQAVTSSQSQVDSTKLGQEVGVRTEVDVLNAQQLHYSARRDLAQARYNFLMSRLRLEAEAGELDEEDLRQINDILVSKSTVGVSSSNGRDPSSVSHVQ